MNENCDCLKKVSELAVKHITEKSTLKNFKVESSRWEHKSWYPSNRIYTRIEFISTFTKKDGSESKPKKDFISIFFTYCPFCGVKIEEEKEVLE
jgi:hypothetical protein